MEYKVAPSLLAADFTRLGEQVHEIEEAGAPYLHLDVMDGAFVPSISFGMPVLKSLRKVTNMTFDVHMMVEKPGRYIEDIRSRCQCICRRFCCFRFRSGSKSKRI